MRTILFVAVLLLARYATVNALDAFELKEFVDGSFVDKKWDGTWLDDKTILFRKDDDAYHVYDVPTNISTLFLSKKSLKDYPNPSITVTSDRKHILIKFVEANNGKTKYALLKKQSGETTLLNDAQTCRFSQRDTLICVNNVNNIYALSLTTLQTTPITIDGNAYTYNGVPDWIYKEEIFRSGTALWPSTIDNKFVYARFDDAGVESYTYPLYGTESEPSVYPKTTSIKYPRVGKINPEFSLHVVTDGTKELSLKFATLTENSNKYVLYDVAWLSANKVVVTYTNREQDTAYYDECDTSLESPISCDRLLSQEDATGWLDILPVFVLDDKKFVLKDVVNGFDTFRIVDVTNSGQPVFKTVSLGNMTVSKIYTHKDKIIYFEGTDAAHHAQQHVYSVNIDQPDVKCLTCDFMVLNQPCTHAKAVFSNSEQITYMTRICSGPGPTYVDIIKLQTPTDVALVWLDNAELRERLAKKKMPIVEDLFYNIPGTDFQAAVRLYLPPGLSKSGATKYPMMVKVYAGPNHNQIVDIFKIGMQHYLTTSRQYIWAFIDGRGSGKRGRKLMHSIYKKLGTHEMDDQIMVTKELVKNFKFIDEERIGIWGWNNGGFAAAHILARDSDTFMCGASVAPMTNYLFHNSFYTERHMGLYVETNAAVKEAYKQTDVTKKAANFKDKNFLLVHANADPSVHYGHSMLLAKALEQAGVIFQQMSYPDEGHYFAGVQEHLYRTLDEHFYRNFENTVKKPSMSSSATSFPKFPFPFLLYFVSFILYFYKL